MIGFFLFLAGIVCAQESSTPTFSALDESSKVKNIGLAVRDIQSGRPTLTSQPTFRNDIDDPNSVQVINAGTGAATLAEFRVSNGVGAANIINVGLNFNDGSNYFPNEAGLVTESGSAGMHIRHNGVVGYIRMTTADIERLRIDASGNVGIGAQTPRALFDVRASTIAGTPIAGTVALIQRAGDTYITMFSSSTGAGGIVFGDEGDVDIGRFYYNHGSELFEMYRSNTRDWLMNSVGVHIQPVGSNDAELEVSNRASTGGGTVHAATYGAHSSANIKTDITYATPQDLQQAYDDVKSLKLVSGFKYKKFLGDQMVQDPAGKQHKGLILEEAPASIKDGESITLNDQIWILEGAVQVLMKKIEDLEAKVK